MPAAPRKKLGELLLEAELIDALQLRSALADQRRWGGRLGRTLVKLGFVEEKTLLEQLSRMMELPLADIDCRLIAPEVIERLPSDMAQRYGVVPLFAEGGSLYVGMEEPADLDTLDALAFHTGTQIRPALVSWKQLQDALDRYYGIRHSGARPASLAVDNSDWQPVDRECLTWPDTPAAEEPVASQATPAVASPQDSSSTAAAQPKPNEREILRALTHLLIEKGLISREELMAKLRSGPSGDES